AASQDPVYRRFPEGEEAPLSASTDTRGGYGQDAVLWPCRGRPCDQLRRRHFNTGTGDRGRAFIALFQPYNPDTLFMTMFLYDAVKPEDKNDQAIESK